MFLKRIFPDTKSLGDFVVVAVLVDLFGNLEFARGEAIVSFQAAESLFQVASLRLFVGDLVEDGV